MVADRGHQSIEQSAVDELEAFRRKTVDLHKTLDALTTELQDSNNPHRQEIVRRAEEAGAALARLEWALERAGDDV